MKTVRQDFKDAGFLKPGAGGDFLLQELECRVWKKYDELKDLGKLTLWGVIDGSGLVKKALEHILGPRPAGC